MATAATFPNGPYRNIREITGQRAILAWKEGVETLVMASALDSEAQTLGWIIPVPAVPEKMDKATPGTLKTLDFCLQPRITCVLAAIKLTRSDAAGGVWTQKAAMSDRPPGVPA